MWEREAHFSICRPVAPVVVQLVASKPSERWDVSSNLGAVTRTGFSLDTIPNKWRTIMSLVHTKFDFTVDEGKEGAVESFSRQKNKARTAEGRWMRNLV